MFSQINHLSKVGGDNAGDCCRRTMRSLLVDDVAAKFNWKGSGGKNAFEKTNMRSIIISEFFF